MSVNGADGKIDQGFSKFRFAGREPLQGSKSRAGDLWSPDLLCKEHVHAQLNKRSARTCVFFPSAPLRSPFLSDIDKVEPPANGVSRCGTV